MPNEAVFFLHALLTLAFVLGAARLGRVWLVALVAAMLVAMNLAVLQQITLFGMDVTGGNVLYAAIFLATDLLAEHWGRREAYRTVRIGFGVSLFFLLTSQAVLFYTPNGLDFARPALETLFSPQWRIIGASMLSYLVVQHLDVWLYERIRRATGGRLLWLRNNGSTWVSQALDSVLFTLGAFAGMEGFAAATLMQMIVFTYLVKVAVALLDTPFLYLSKTRALRPVVRVCA